MSQPKQTRASILSLALRCISAAAVLLPLSVTLTDAALILGSLLGMLNAQFRQTLTTTFKHPVVLFCILLLCLACIGSIHSEASDADLMRRLHKMAKFIYIPFIYAACLQARAYDSLIKRFTWTLVGIAGLTILAKLIWLFCPSIRTFLHTHHVFGRHFLAMPDSLFHDHIVTSHMMSIALAILILAKQSKHNWVSNRTFYPSCLMLLISIFWVNESRMGYLLCLGLLGLVILQTIPWKQGCLLLIGLPVLAGAITLSSSTVQHAIHTTVTHMQSHQHNQDETSIGLRMTLFKNASTMVKQNPWLGCGTGCFHTAYQQFHAKDSTRNYFAPENEYLLYAVQFGVFGALLLLAWFGANLYAARLLSTYPRHILQCVLASVFVSNFSSVSISSNSIGTMLMFFIGLSLAQQTQGTPCET